MESNEAKKLPKDGENEVDKKADFSSVDVIGNVLEVKSEKLMESNELKKPIDQVLLELDDEFALEGYQQDLTKFLKDKTSKRYQKCVSKVTEVDPNTANGTDDNREANITKQNPKLIATMTAMVILTASQRKILWPVSERMLLGRGSR